MDDKKIKVLVVDDESDFRQLMTFWLESKKYSVIASSNGRDAIGMVKKDKPDIVFLDLMMPEMDGIQTLKQIRKVNKDIPVIIISAYVEDARIVEAKYYNISGVFYKGKDFKEGSALLEAVLRTHKRLKSK